MKRQVKIINGETAIKPYFYFRNGLLHVRYNVDRAIELSPSEIAELKKAIEGKEYDKQNILADKWSFYSDCVGKTIIHDGIAVVEDKIHEYKH